jgi:hypothetical protein
MSSRARVWPALVALVMLTVLAGCVQVPTSGSVEPVEGRQDACQSCVNVQVAPPTAGDDPGQIVEAYLRATSIYQPNYSIAKQFLTKAAAEQWHPDDGVTIYQGSLKGNGGKVRLVGRLVGSLSRNLTYTAQDEQLQMDFHLVKEDGEWRISQPPRGLMVAQYYFDQFYQPYQVYFVGNHTSLVPQRIYLPTLGSPANVASALMAALLTGPRDWLKPAVDTAIPVGTSLSATSVTITNSIAEVALSERVLTLSDQDRSLMAAQIVYTLKQASGIKGVLITVDKQPYRVMQSDPTSMVIPVDAFSRDIDPVPFVSGDRLYAIQDGVVSQVTATSDSPQVTPVGGDVAKDRHPVDSLAVSMNGTDLALVTGGRTTLRRAPTATGEETTLTRSMSHLLRPQFTRYGEVWALGQQDGKQKMVMFPADPNIQQPEPEPMQIEVDAPVLKQAEVTAFRISPDGCRMALVRRTSNGSELGLARIIRVRSGGKVRLDGWHPLNLTQTGGTQVTRIADVAWLDATEMLLLGAASEEADLGPVRVTADASRIIAESGEPATWDPRELTVLFRPQTTVVVGADGQTWRDNGSQWLPFLDNVKTIAYPG